MCRLRLPRRAPRNVAHESTVTRPQSAAIANVISNFPGADLNEAAMRRTLSRVAEPTVEVISASLCRRGGTLCDPFTPDHA